METIDTAWDMWALLLTVGSPLRAATGNTDNLRKYLHWFAVCTFCCVKFYFYPPRQQRRVSTVQWYQPNHLFLESAPHLQSCNYIFNPTTQEQLTVGSWINVHLHINCHSIVKRGHADEIHMKSIYLFHFHRMVYNSSHNKCLLRQLQKEEVVPTTDHPGISLSLESLSRASPLPVSCLLTSSKLIWNVIVASNHLQGNCS